MKSFTFICIESFSLPLSLSIHIYTYTHTHTYLERKQVIISIHNRKSHVPHFYVSPRSYRRCKDWIWNEFGNDYQGVFGQTHFFFLQMSTPVSGPGARRWFCRASEFRMWVFFWLSWDVTGKMDDSVPLIHSTAYWFYMSSMYIVCLHHYREKQEVRVVIPLLQPVIPCCALWEATDSYTWSWDNAT